MMILKLNLVTVGNGWDAVLSEGKKKDPIVSVVNYFILLNIKKDRRFYTSPKDSEML